MSATSTDLIHERVVSALSKGEMRSVGCDNVSHQSRYFYIFEPMASIPENNVLVQRVVLPPTAYTSHRAARTEEAGMDLSY